MKTIYKIVGLIAGIMILISCSSDYLDTLPTESAATTEVFTTVERAALAVNGLSRSMTRQYLETQGYNGEGTIKLYYGDFPGNHMYYNRSSHADLLNSMYVENTTATENYYPWFYYYKIILNANMIIEQVDGVSGDARKKEFVKAQALTFRAYCYMMLVQLYSRRWSDNQGASPGVVLRVTSSSDAMPLSTLGEVYEQIYKDLDDAISLYTSSGIKRGENYEPDMNVAYATYARASLNRQDYKKAEEMAQKAYNGYPLMSLQEYKDGFCKPNKEWIWSCYGAIDETLHYYSYFAYIAYNSSASAVRTYPKCISKELYEQIPEDDIRRGLFLDPTGYKYTTSNGRVTAGSELDIHARELFPETQDNATIYAYMQFKIGAEDMPGVGHLNLFRSSEMYLIEAEAKYFQGNYNGAQEILETLIKDSERNIEYTCDKTGEELFEEIKLYRAVELWGEGMNWFDLKRWGDSRVRNGVSKGGNFIASLAITYGPTERNNWTWRIPKRETDYNDQI